MRDRQTCIDCRKLSPETETNYTLISAQFGWRLSRRRTDAGEFVIEWRCAECWREHKKKADRDEPSSADKLAAERRPSMSRTAVATATRSSRPPPRTPSKPPSSAPSPGPRKRS